MTDIKSSTHQDLEFDGQAMTIFEDGACWLVVLDDWEIAVILSSLRYAHWLKRWRNLGGHTWDEIEANITQLEHCLMAGCDVSLLLEKFDTLNETLTTLAGRFVTPEDKGIAELVEDLELTCGDTTVNFDTAAIVNAIEAQTTMQETRSIAEVTAQNTNFSDMVTAVEGLELVANCAPDVNVDCPPPVVNVQGGCGGVTGCELEQEAGEEGGTPPPGTREPDPIENRKCNAANYIYDTFLGMIEKLMLEDVDNLGVVGITTATTMIGALLGFATFGPIGGAIVGTVGLIVGIVVSLITATSLDLQDIKDVMEDNHEDLVCALYNATTAEQAREDFVTILNDGGCNEVESGFMSTYFLINGVMNMLFFTPDSANGDALEAELDGYEGSVECGVCTECETLKILWGTLLTGDNWQAEYDTGTGHYWIGLSFNALPGAGWTEKCGLNVEVTLSNPAGITKSGNTPIFRLGSGDIIPGQGCTGWDVHCGDTLPTGGNCLTHLAIASATNFTIDISIGADCQES